MRIRVLFLFLMALLCQAQQAEDRVALKERMWVSSKIYAAILQYFGHWQGVPDLKLDEVYRRYLEQIAATDDRLTFDLATMEFMAHLRNGHSDFGDRWLANRAHPVGFQLDLVDGRWTVRRSSIEGLEPRDLITAIDGMPTDEFMADRMKYIGASDDRARRAKVFYSGFLWPQSFTLTFQDQRKLTVDRTNQKWSARPNQPPAPAIPDGVVYHRIPSFGEPRFEQAAIDFVKANTGAGLIIFDVRGNNGGSTPTRLLRALIDRPYRGWMEASSMSFGLFATYGELYRTVIPKDADARLRGYLEGFADYFERPYFLKPGPLQQPENPIYTGRISVLQDRDCASACEDFVMPLKYSQRATIFGERTFGSSGQPYMLQFGNGMGFRVSTKRMFFPDGAEFEGVGISPNVEVAQLSGAPRDAVLEAALQAYTTK